MKHRAATPPIALLLLAAALGSGCERVGRFTGGNPEDRLVAAAVGRWAAMGRPFFDGASGRDTVASVNPTGARAWEVAVIPPSGGVPVVWSLEVTRAEVYPVVPGRSFATWLRHRARELGMRTSLPADVIDSLSSGRIQAVGDLEVRYGAADRTGRVTERRVAYLTPGGAGAPPTWSVQPASAPAAALLEALETVVDDMVRADERVMTCLGSGMPRRILRSVQLACVRKAWNQDFAPEAR